MKAIAGKEFCKLLESKGWHCARIHGSHHIYIQEGNHRTNLRPRPRFTEPQAWPAAPPDEAGWNW